MTGRGIFSSIDPQDPTTVSFPFLRRMRRHHGVSMALHYIITPHVKSQFFFEADDARVAAFADNLVRPIYGTTISTIMRHLSYGYSPAVKNFEVVNPSWTYVMDGEKRQVWDSEVVDALIYKPPVPLKPESCRLGYDNNGRWNGILWDEAYVGHGGFRVGGETVPQIDLAHSLWAVHDRESEDGSPYGYPRISYAAPIFHSYRYIWTLLMRAFEDNADPGPVVRFPEDENSRGADEESNKDTALRIGTRKRSGSTIAMPSRPYANYANDRTTSIPMWSIEYPKIETNFEAIQSFLSYLDALTFRALWLSEQSLTEGAGASSSRNVMSSASSQRDASQIVLMQQIMDDVFMNQLVRPAMAINMPWYEGKLEMKTLGFGQDDEDVVRQIFQLAGQRDLNSFGIDLPRLADSKGFPMLSAEERAKQMKDAIKQADQSVPPPIEPTQGRRALVTQTGFDEATGRPEMSYVQLNDPIDLSSGADGDFVASLPQTETWEDRQVVDAARTLRSRSADLLAWAYRDAAIYLSKREGEVATFLDEDHPLDQDEDHVELAVRRLTERWAPDEGRVARYLSAVRRALARVYDRTASIHLSRLRSDKKVSSRDEVAARWLEERGAQLVTGILQTTRDELASFMADLVREGKTKREIADEIKTHFASFPDTRATTIARTEVSTAYNYATVTTGIAAGVKKAQLLDGTDDECAKRNGRIVDIEDALKEKLAHPNCALSIRLLPNAPANLEVHRTRLDNEYLARYDDEAHVVLLSSDITDDQESEYLLALGARFVAQF